MGSRDLDPFKVINDTSNHEMSRPEREETPAVVDNSEDEEKDEVRSGDHELDKCYECKETVHDNEVNPGPNHGERTLEKRNRDLYAHC